MTTAEQKQQRHEGLIGGMVRLRALTDAEREQQQSSDAPAVRRFDAEAYTGVVVQTWFGSMIVDLEGIEVPERELPLLLRHGWGDGDDSPRLGVIEGCALEDASGGGRALMARGRFLSNDAAAGVLADADEGFPFQFSIGFDIVRTEFLESGESATVNGKELTGPMEIVRHARLHEGSIVELGADSNTTVETLARRRDGAQKGDPMAENEKTRELEKDDVATLPESDDEAMAWLQEHRPELVSKLMEKGDDAGDEEKPAGTSDDEQGAMQAAGIAELRALEGADSDFVLAMVQLGASIDVAKEQLAWRTKETQRLSAAAAGGGDQAKPLPASDGGGGSAGATWDEANPEASFEADESLRMTFGGSKGAFLSFVRDEKKRGGRWTDALRAEQAA